MGCLKFRRYSCGTSRNVGNSKTETLRSAFLFRKLHSPHEILKAGVIMQETQPGIHPEKRKHFVPGRVRPFQPGESLLLVAEPGKDHSKRVGGNVLFL